MALKWLIIICIVTILAQNTISYDNIWNFDQNEDVIINTVVYNTTGKPCLNCSCNLTIHNPQPFQNVINASFMMNNSGNGVYSVNLTRIGYNKGLYPVVIVCNDSLGFFGGDNRDGIKIGETLFDYTALMIVTLTIGGFLLFSAFKIDKTHTAMIIISYMGSFLFLMLGVWLGRSIAEMSPNSAQFVGIMDILFFLLTLVFIVLLYLRFIEEIISALNKMMGHSDNKKK